MKPLVLWRVKSIRNRIDKVYSSDKDPIHDMLLDLPHIVGTLSGYLGSPALRAAFTCSKMERLTGLWERLGELSQRPGAAPTPKSSPTEDQSPNKAESLLPRCNMHRATPASDLLFHGATCFLQMS